MSARLTLTLPPNLGSKTIEVNSKRFSIGRTPENDLVIDDSSLSRRHALIESFEGRFNLSDCGSSNGTFVNGRPVTGLTELSDWDVLTFGGVSDIVVRIDDESHSADEAPVDAVPASLTHQASVAFPRSAKSWLTGPVIAGGTAVLILLVAGAALLVSKNSNSSGGSKRLVVNRQQPDTDNDNDNSSVKPANDSVTSPSVENSGPINSGNTDSSELSTIEAYASRVLTGISRDTHPVLTEKPLAEINAQIQRYKGSSVLRDELQAMKRALPQVSAAAKTNGVRTPLAVYATLARMSKDGERGDPAQVAASLCPLLAKMRAIFGDETANDSLLSVAALEEGPSLQAKITKLGRVSESVTTIRSIWYLHDHQVISDQTYNFVLRFLAIGVIAQNPQKFGIAAEPLAF